MNDTSLTCTRIVPQPTLDTPCIKLLSLRGLNIQNKWAQKILSGEKTVELRTYPIGSYSDEALWIIATPGEDRSVGKAMVVGIVMFGGSSGYKNMDDVYADVDRHQVPKDDRFFAPKRKADTKQAKFWAWQVSQVVRLVDPREGPDVKGMIGSRAFRLAVELDLSASDAGSRTESASGGDSRTSADRRTRGVGKVHKPRPGTSPTNRFLERQGSKLFGLKRRAVARPSDSKAKDSEAPSPASGSAPPLPVLSSASSSNEHFAHPAVQASLESYAI